MSRALLYKKNKDGIDLTNSDGAGGGGDLSTCCVFDFVDLFLSTDDDDTGARNPQHQRDFDDVEMFATQLTNKQHGDFASLFYLEWNIISI